MTVHTFTALFPFCGLGGGAHGFAQAEARIFQSSARFRVLGGIDHDPESCADFERIAGAPAWCAAIEEITSSDLRSRYGKRAPDVVFLSPPCKGASGLLSAEKAATEKYQQMNRLAEVWISKMLEAWDEPPKIVLFENVPRLKQRAGSMLRRVRSMLRAAGYILHDGFHECGEIGGLAQIRKRFLLVARHPGRVPPLLYQPPRRRVRGCGEVLGQLPLPGDPSAGPMHKLPRLSWLNWVRLALIPAGGDWRDLEGVLRDGQAKREVFKRHGVQAWDAPTGTIAGSGSNGPSAVADPRGASLGAHWNKMRVEDWDKPSHTVTGSDRVGSGAPSVADPRHELAVRVAYDHGYGVLRWDEPSSTIAGKMAPGCGAYSVADLRFSGEYYRGTYGVLTWQEAAGTITGNTRFDCGRFTVADPRKPPPWTPVIIAADGTWHRPLTELDVAALQGLPTEIDGKPLALAGPSVGRRRERIGNAVPPPTAKAIAERMLVALLQAETEAFALAPGGYDVWVREQIHEATT